MTYLDSKNDVFRVAKWHQLTPIILQPWGWEYKMISLNSQNDVFTTAKWIWTSYNPLRCHKILSLNPPNDVFRTRKVLYPHKGSKMITLNQQKYFLDLKMTYLNAKNFTTKGPIWISFNPQNDVFRPAKWYLITPKIVHP